MNDAPLHKPAHLRPETGRAAWLIKHAAGVTAFALGALAFIVVAVAQDRLWATPDWRLSVPGFVVTAIAAAISIARRERAHVLWLVGLGLAATAVVLGWFLMLAIVVAATAALVFVLHHVL